MQTWKRLLVALEIVVVALLAGCEAGARTPTLGFVFTDFTTDDQQSYVARSPVAESLGIRLASHFVPSDLHAGLQGLEEFLDQEQPTVVVLHGASKYALALAPLLAREKIPHIITVATSTELVDITRYTHRLVPSDTTQVEALVDFAVTRRGIRRPAVLYVRDDFGASLVGSLGRAFRARNVTDPLLIPMDTASDFSLLVDAIAELDERDGVIFGGYAHMAMDFVPLLRKRLPDIPVVATDAILAPYSALAAGSWGNVLHDVCLPAYWLPGGGSQLERDFRAHMATLTPRPPLHSDALLSDGLRVGAHAVAAGSSRAEAQRFLATLSDRGPSVRGLTGRLGFGEQRREIIRMACVDPHRDPPLASAEDDPAFEAES